MRDVASLPAGIERQFLAQVRPPKRGDRALLWLDGAPLEITVTGCDGEVVRFVFGGYCVSVPADRVTTLTGVSL